MATCHFFVAVNCVKSKDKDGLIPILLLMLVVSFCISVESVCSSNNFLPSSVIKYVD